MLKQDITYESFDGEKTDPFYFNLNKVEAQRFLQGPLARRITDLTEKLGDEEPSGEDANAMISAIEELVLMAYGKREGEQFVKNDKVREEFRGSVQFGELVSGFVTDVSKFFEFFVGIMPKDMRGVVRDAMNTAATEAGIPSPVPVLEATGTVPEPQAQSTAPVSTTMTRAEVTIMNADELQEKLAAGWTIVD